MWFNLEKIDVAQPHSIRYSLKLENNILPATPEEVFAVFSSDNWHEWFTDILSVEWLSTQKRCEGAIRQVNLKSMKVREHFTIWEENERMGFYLEKISIPFVKAMGEDYQLVPLADDQTRFDWYIYYDLTFIGRLIHPILKSMYTKTFTKTVESLKKYLEEHT